MIFISSKFKTLAAIYLTAALIVLALYAAVSAHSLVFLRRGTLNASTLHLEQSVYAVENLTAALKKSAYAADPGMCSRVCAEIYANSLAAQAELSGLPFSTQELEKLSAFINTAGDYAYMLCGEGSADGFSQTERETLSRFAQTCGDLSAALREMHSAAETGGLSLDSREKRLRNFPEEDEHFLSAALLDYDSGFEGMGALEYDGRYTVSETAAAARDAEELRRDAEKFLERPKAAFEYADGRACFTDGDLSLTVGAEGEYSLFSSRLVGESRLEPEQAQKAAEKFLAERGYEGAELIEGEIYANIAYFTYAAAADGVRRLDRPLRVAIALDDGSIYGFESTADAEDEELEWRIDERAAVQKLPEGTETESVSRCVLRSAGGQSLPCYELDCGEATVYINALTGRQQEIVING